MGGVGNIDKDATAEFRPNSRRANTRARRAASSRRPQRKVLLATTVARYASRRMHWSLADFDQFRSRGHRGESTSTIAPRSAGAALISIELNDAIGWECGDCGLSTRSPLMLRRSARAKFKRGLAGKRVAISRKSSPTSIPAITVWASRTRGSKESRTEAGTRACHR